MSVTVSPKMKDSGVKWIGAIPHHWQVRKLKHWVRFLNYRRIPISSENRAELTKEYPYYGASGIIDYVNDYIFDQPHILIAEDGANLLSRSSPLAFLATGKYWVNNHAHILKPISGNLSYWVARLETNSYVPFVTGSAQPKLTIENLASIEFAAPSPEEQDRIGVYLDRKTAQIDTLIAKKQRLIELLQEKRQALISRAVTKGLDPTVPMKDSGIGWLGEIPTHWTVLRLKQLCSVLQDGTHLPPPRTDSGFPLLSVRNIVDGRFVNLPDDSMISEEDFRELTKTVRPQLGDVLLAIVGATMGKVAIVEEMPPFAIQRSLGIFRTAPRLMNPEYLGYWLRGWFFQRLLWENTGYSAQPGIYLGALADFPATVPPLDEQQQLVESLNDSVGRIDGASEKLRVQITKLQEYRQTLISAAVTGKIDVRKEAHP